MTKEQAIKFLQQIYPNGGHCWLDEQRIEAIGMAVKALCEEPLYTDFTKALAECIHQAQGSVVDPMVLAEIWKDELVKLAKGEEPVSEELGDYINELSKQFPEVSFAKLSRIAVRAAKWQKEQMMAKAIDAKIWSFTNGTIYDADFNIDSNLIDDDKVKVIVIKEE